MKCATITLLVACIALGAVASDLGNSATQKPRVTTLTPSPIDPQVIRQGGDTFDDAIAIPEIPYTTTGTTSGFTDDYDEACPYSGSTSPDVVYKLIARADIDIDVDLCGSAYDTKVYLYDADMNLVACNDDFYYDDDCGDYVSRLRFAPIIDGTSYYLVVDGYGGEYGEYQLNIREDEYCELDCPAQAYLEGEPPLVDDYEDAYNGGCNSPQYGEPWQDLYGDENGELVFCGVSGWYDYLGSHYRDTDWFYLHVGESGVVELEAEAEWATYFWEVTTFCSMAVLPNILVEECDSGTMTIEALGEIIGFWVGPTVFEPPSYAVDNEYDYVIHFSGLMPVPVATESVSWSAVKALFR
ncbi:MAG TPA: hypothetical protein PLL30_16300 [Candidatus Krumholzibacteria bacterium]|nr:hypothetical protein [Candidatus Krumholzibacteria bacterium]HPD73333.1 hypothetical protein [Candidatus Krumholzibacteria bacterium]HRY42146.1 hypothetical protein [Candidatus Krumholzibacteria bacterium]